jgi:hypothetical protein
MDCCTFRSITSWTTIKRKTKDTTPSRQKSNWKIWKICKIDTPNTHTRPLTFLVLDRHFNKDWRGLTSFMGPNLPLLVKWLGHASVFYMRVKLCQGWHFTVTCEGWHFTVICEGWHFTVICEGWHFTVICEGWHFTVICQGWHFTVLCQSWNWKYINIEYTPPHAWIIALHMVWKLWSSFRNSTWGLLVHSSTSASQ